MVNLEDIAHLPLVEGKPKDIILTSDFKVYEIAEMGFKIREKGELRDTNRRELKYVIGRYTCKSETFGDLHCVLFSSDRYSYEGKPSRMYFKDLMDITEVCFYQTIAKFNEN